MALKTTKMLKKEKVNDRDFTAIITVARSQYRDIHLSSQKITELVPGKKVVWHVLDSRLNFVKDKTEWNGTDIVFDIAKKDDKTELRFTHVGLVPALACYGDCSDAWGYYIKDRLKRLITTGKGQPHLKEKGYKKKAA